jgi:hypothetical protein
VIHPAALAAYLNDALQRIRREVAARASKRG